MLLLKYEKDFSGRIATYDSFFQMENAGALVLGSDVLVFDFRLNNLGARANATDEAQDYISDNAPYYMARQLHHGQKQRPSVAMNQSLA